MSKKTESVQKVKLPEAPAEEQQLTQITLEAAQNQLAQLLQQFQLQQQAQAAAMPALTQLQAGVGYGDEFLAPEDRQRIAQERYRSDLEAARAQQELLGLELERIRTGVATPEQQAQLERAANLAIEMGQEDINRLAEQQTQMLSRELAPGLGLRPGDTPIVSRGQEIAKAAIREGGQLVRNIRGQQAQQMVNLPLQAGALGQSLLGFTAGPTTAEQLRQQAIQNRLALAGQAGQLGLGLSGIGNIPGSLSVIQQPRMAQTTTWGKTKSSDPLGTGLGIAGAVGGLMSGAGAGMSGLGAMGFAPFCWVAAEYYGWYTPEWWMSREWILNGWKTRIGERFRKLYWKHGKKIASLVRRNRLVRALLRTLFDWTLRKGLEYTNGTFQSCP